MKIVVFSFAVLSVFATEDLAKHPNWQLLDRGDECGLATGFRVIEELKAFLGQFPWMARISYSNKSTDQNDPHEGFDCGGAVISERYVLTAAHCVTDNTTVVRLGEHNVATDLDCEEFCADPTQDIDVEEHICHSEYSVETKDNDICLIRLVKPIKFSRFVDPICLPTPDLFKNKSFEGEVAEVIGWRWMNVSTEKDSDVLLTEKLRIVSSQECQSAYEGERNITDTQLCVGDVVRNNSCVMDSGGPLMRPVSVPPGPSRYFLLGLVSFGENQCGQRTRPVVYTKVSEYMTWVLDNIRE